MSEIPDAIEAPDFREPDEDSGQREFFSILPPDCLVTPLGFKGNKQFLLDHAQQLREATPRQLDKGELQSLFGGSKAVAALWPKMEFNKESQDWQAKRHFNHSRQRWEIWDFDQNRAQDDLVSACAAKGIFDPQGRLFGRGAHRRDRDGALIFHLGNRVIVVGVIDKKGKAQSTIEELQPGFVDRQIYPALPAIPPPAASGSSSEEGERFMKMIDEWSFEQPAAARVLMLGFVGECYLCGAFSWRAHVWLTGETSAGKSTLQKLIRSILGEFGLFTEDASEAAVRQVLGDDTLPVLIDEAEADDNPDRQRAMINLARKSSSGAKIHRGSADHKARDFTAQSAFMFSSILHSPLDPQDRNRIAILAMKAIPENKDELAIDWQYWREAGTRYHMRMIEQWPRFERTLTFYKNLIQAEGFQGRWRATFGTLLACADMLLYSDSPNSEGMDLAEFGRGRTWVQDLLPLMLRGRLEAESTSDRCIAHLTSFQLPASPGHPKETVGSWITRAHTRDEDGNPNMEARRKLKEHGLRLVNLHSEGAGKLGYKEEFDPARAYLAIAYQTNAGVREIFKGEKWYGGGWVQALALVPDAHSCVKIHFTGGKANAICIPISAILGDGADREGS